MKKYLLPSFGIIGSLAGTSEVFDTQTMNWLAVAFPPLAVAVGAPLFYSIRRIVRSDLVNAYQFIKNHEEYMYLHGKVQKNSKHAKKYRKDFLKKFFSQTQLYTNELSKPSRIMSYTRNNVERIIDGTLIGAAIPSLIDIVNTFT